MPRFARISVFSALVPVCALMFSAQAHTQTAPQASPVMTQAFTCPVDKPVLVAATTPAASALPPPPPPQEVVKPKAYETNKGFPRWSDFPPPPTDVPDEAEFGRRVAALAQTRDLFVVSLNGLQWDVSTPEAIKVEGMARINTAYLTPIETMTCEEYAEFVRLKQKLATPPPIADN